MLSDEKAAQEADRTEAFKHVYMNYQFTTTHTLTAVATGQTAGRTLGPSIATSARPWGHL